MVEMRAQKETGQVETLLNVPALLSQLQVSKP
jgi:hypothetical protein